MSSTDEITRTPDLPKLLSTEDLAQVLGITPGGVRYRRQHGLPLPPGQLISRDWAYCRNDVERWLHEQQAESGPG
jgi:hypothetical protein